MIDYNQIKNKENNLLKCTKHKPRRHIHHFPSLLRLCIFARDCCLRRTETMIHYHTNCTPTPN